MAAHNAVHGEVIISPQHYRDLRSAGLVLHQSSNHRCLLCSDFDDDNSWQTGDLDSTFQSAKNGCVGCEALTSVLTASFGRYSSICVISWTLRGSFLYPYLYLRPSAYPPPDEDILPRPPPSMVFQLFTTTKDTCPLPILRRVDLASMNTASEQALEKLRNWMRECSNSHELCKRLLDTPLLPTRVVEIIDSKTVRLHVSSNEKSIYTCLSHCWGAEPLIRTTKASLIDYQHSIPWTDLPKTFQDAIDITSRLGIKYIWIDSLCIIQDDLDDWRHEGTQMCDIYSRSYLTIAASKAEESKDGCYAVADDTYDSNHWFLNARNERYHIGARRCIRHLHERVSMELEREKWYPLLSRAWVYQERLLSPRTVHFGPVELYWECRMGYTCECSGWQLADMGDGYSRTMQPNLPAAVTPSEKRQLWHNVVHEYTNKTLRYETDIFPALQGIAKSLKWDSDYYAGIWKTETLLSSLLWSPKDGVRPTAWRAPSWSWASVKAQIYFRDHMRHLDNLAAIISIQTIPLGHDPFGQLLSGQLKIKGFCIQAYYGLGEWKDCLRVRAPSITHPRVMYKDGEWARCLEPIESETRFGDNWPDCADDSFPKDVKIMAISRMEKGDDEVVTVCLMFEHAGVEEGEEVYMRVGVTELVNDVGTFEKFGGKEPVVLTVV